MLSDLFRSPILPEPASWCHEPLNPSLPLCWAACLTDNVLTHGIWPSLQNQCFPKMFIGWCSAFTGLHIGSVVLHYLVKWQTIILFETIRDRTLHVWANLRHALPQIHRSPPCRFLRQEKSGSSIPVVQRNCLHQDKWERCYLVGKNLFKKCKKLFSLSFQPEFKNKLSHKFYLQKEGRKQFPGIRKFPTSQIDEFVLKSFWYWFWT